MLDREQLVRQLHALGVERGGVLVVHTAFSKVGPLDDGPRTLIEVLREVLGPDGTLVMPSMSDDDEHPFDVRSTPCLSLGVVPDTFRALSHPPSRDPSDRKIRIRRDRSLLRELRAHG